VCLRAGIKGSPDVERSGNAPVIASVSTKELGVHEKKETEELEQRVPEGGKVLAGVCSPEGVEVLLAHAKSVTERNMWAPIHGEAHRFVYKFGGHYYDTHAEESKAVHASTREYKSRKDLQSVCNAVVATIKEKLSIPDSFGLRTLDLMCKFPGTSAQRTHQDCTGFNLNASLHLTSGHSRTDVEGSMATTGASSAGDATVFRANGWHAGPANETKENRYTLFVSWGPNNTENPIFK
jgi:hypothetical protein